MKKALLPLLFGLAACSGYSPLYAPKTHTDVTVGAIQMEMTSLNVGERRVAQRVSQKLRQSFPQAQGAYRVEATIEESIQTLAVRRNATVARAQMSLKATVTLYENAENKEIFKTDVGANASYNMEDTPYSTDSGKAFARMQAADVLATEITRVIWLAIREQNAAE